MSTEEVLATAIAEADDRIHQHIRRTPVEHSHWLSAATGADVYLKLENHQLTGSFKLRGALNRVLASEAAVLASGFVAASTGNHGLAMAHATAIAGAELKVFVPTTADTAKIELLRERAIDVECAGVDCTEAEAAARDFALRRGATYVSPYNDLAVVAGQGTVGLELSRQLPEIDVAFVALGGGGLIAGTAAALAAAHSGAEIVGCSPQASAVMARSLEAGRILDLPSEATLSDGTAGGVEEGSLTFDLCRRWIDRCALVAESQIAAALGDFLRHHHSLIEGAAAVPIAALLATGSHLAGKRVVVILCGANIAPATLAAVLTGTPRT